MKSHSVEDVLRAISDIKSLDMFCSIAKESVVSDVLKQIKGLSRKQYYSRTGHLLKVGLIKRKKGRFSLTAFGAVVYHAHIKTMEDVIANYWPFDCGSYLYGSAIPSLKFIYLMELSLCTMENLRVSKIKLNS
jgi:hypothetical protein